MGNISHKKRKFKMKTMLLKKNWIYHAKIGTNFPIIQEFPVTCNTISFIKCESFWFSGSNSFLFSFYLHYFSTEIVNTCVMDFKAPDIINEKLSMVDSIAPPCA